MRKILVFVLLISSIKLFAQHILTRFEISEGKQTPTYFEILEWWKKLASTSSEVKILEMGPTDAGYHLHLILVSTDKDFNIRSIKAKGKNIILINNGIHPGEPDGIDASMLLVRDIVEKKYNLPDHVILAIIPVYNIGGCLNRSKNYRPDQNGPDAFGFRGNSQNLDLNRDFIKCDSKEAFTFTKIFHYLDPDILVDNHVSDGADYQHIMTLLTTQYNKLGGKMGDYLHAQFEPALYKLMTKKGYDLVPYVNHTEETPDNGWTAYWDSPRYSSGYAALWNTFSFIPETHMLKPYKQRVESTKALMESFIEFTSLHGYEIRDLRRNSIKEQMTQKSFSIAWKLNKSSYDEITFKGYQAVHKTSEVSGLPRLFYDRTKTFVKKVPFYNYFEPSINIEKANAYIIPQGWWKVIDRLKANEVYLEPLKADTIIQVQWYHIENFQSSSRPYEGHHSNYNVKLSINNSEIKFRKGDYLIPLNQKANRFIIETLEPEAEDSYFTWNFFDPILGQKEGYSDYHFEDIAADYLKKHPELQKILQEKKNKDSTFANNADDQLNFIYQNSPYFEPAYLQYPVYRIMK